MIRNRHTLEAFERDQMRRTPQDLTRNPRLMDGLVQEARALEKWPAKDPMADMDWKIEFVRRLNLIPPGIATPTVADSSR